ncbi:SDR family NAD(P)-dependent oxidoreductase [Aquirufa ecclesiirivi]|uniref:SDR family NAD(P)-dependent oxidoreductase n=1 Tax=Aquirufa ecclesiirivi TaxID=2715124 RepID=UPI0023D8355E|nr:glucose 1-dehydrogenase [Aquirufa ecclesiirivi]MDF0692552.1 glucose 1-dehydrogenase [Aquirufa ecclesiirivi]
MENKFSLAGKVALITGGGTGIGFDMAKCMLASGANVIITGRRENVLQDAVHNLGAGAFYFVHDMADVNATPGLVADIIQSHGKIDILVNNAGINMKRPAVDVSNDDFAQIIQVNLNAVFVLSREVGKHMLERKSGSIIMISSMAAYYGIDRVAAYASSKSGLYGLVRVLASEWSAQGVRVNAIAPGFIETAMSKTAMNSDPDRKHKAMDRTPMGYFGKPEDVAWTAVFLASDAAGYITGVSIPVDGGNSIGF